MAGTNDNLRVWGGADVAFAPYGTTAPTTLAESLDGAFEYAGLLTDDDGLTISRTSNKKDIFTWGGALGRSIANKSKSTFKFVPAEYNDFVNELQNPGRQIVTGSGEVTIYRPVPTLHTVEWVCVWDLVDGDVHLRKVFPKVKIDPDGDITIKDEDLDAPPITANIYPVTMTPDGGVEDQIESWDCTDAGALVSPAS